MTTLTMLSAWTPAEALRQLRRGRDTGDYALPAVLGGLLVAVDRLTIASTQVLVLGLAWAAHAVALIPGNDDGDRVWRLG